MLDKYRDGYTPVPLRTLKLSQSSNCMGKQ